MTLPLRPFASLAVCPLYLRILAEPQQRVFLFPAAEDHDGLAGEIAGGELRVDRTSMRRLLT